LIFTFDMLFLVRAVFQYETAGVTGSNQFIAFSH
jgi:hypothetical protein